MWVPKQLPCGSIRIVYVPWRASDIDTWPEGESGVEASLVEPFGAVIDTVVDQADLLVRRAGEREQHVLAGPAVRPADHDAVCDDRVHGIAGHHLGIERHVPGARTLRVDVDDVRAGLRQRDRAHEVPARARRE